MTSTKEETMHASASSNATRELEDVKVMEKEKTMHASRHATRELEDVNVHVKLKLAGLWASVMFMFVYVDVIGFYRPGVIEAILAGFMWKFEITQTVLVAGETGRALDESACDERERAQGGSAPQGYSSDHSLEAVPKFTLAFLVENSRDLDPPIEFAGTRLAPLAVQSDEARNRLNEELVPART